MKLLTLSVVLAFTLAAEAKTLDISLPKCSFMSGCPPGLTLDEERCRCVLPPCTLLIRKACPTGSYLNKECECETDDCGKLSPDVCTQVKCACGKYCGLGTIFPGIFSTPPRSYCAACGCCSTFFPRPTLGPLGPQIPDERFLPRSMSNPCSGRCPDIALP